MKKHSRNFAVYLIIALILGITIMVIFESNRIKNNPQSAKVSGPK